MFKPTCSAPGPLRLPAAAYCAESQNPKFETPKQQATEITENTEGKSSVLSVFSVAPASVSGFGFMWSFTITMQCDLDHSRFGELLGIAAHGFYIFARTSFAPLD